MNLNRFVDHNHQQNHDNVAMKSEVNLIRVSCNQLTRSSTAAPGRLREASNLRLRSSVCGRGGTSIGTSQPHVDANMTTSTCRLPLYMRSQYVSV
ncbi:hypothetical protein J6590_014432 [Homalodisca vitripennis]|nr:hypothetical protein J6590_014432 [Homalodisca vitripennis]